MAPRIPPLLPAALQRRVARAAVRRPGPGATPLLYQSSLRCISTSLPSFAPPRISKRFSTPPTPAPAALSALLSRLSLPPNSSLHSALVTCLTHPSYASPPASSAASSSTPPKDVDANANVEANDILSALGNSLLGLFASEHLANAFPHLPTEALKSAVTAYVGPRSCYAVARELGVGVLGAGIGQGFGPGNSGVQVRFNKDAASRPRAERVPVARRFQKYLPEEAEVEHKRESHEEIVATAARSFVALIYQEKGMAAARDFVHAHFLSRHLNMSDLFNFKNPKHVLSSVVARQLAQAGVSPGDDATRIESRILASTGTHSQAPLFNIGLFLPSGLKLGEGHGSSLKMAEHRAAVNALLSIFLVRNDTGAAQPAQPAGRDGRDGSGQVIEGDGQGTASGLPTSAHARWAITGGRVEAGKKYLGEVKVGSETIVESRQKAARG